MKSIDLEILQTGNLEFLAHQVVEGFITGLHKSPYHGFSVEFAEHRQYYPGESTKNIDWKLFAKTDKLFVKRYEEETNLRCQMVIDTSASMYFPSDSLSKLRFAAIASASLAVMLRKQRDATGLTLINQNIDLQLPPKSSMVALKQIFITLENALQKKAKPVEGNFSQTLHALSETIHRRSLVILFSDFLGSNLNQLNEALQHLRYNRHEVIVMHVSDMQHEDLFTYANRPYEFIDSESGEILKLNPQAYKEQYLKANTLFKKDLEDICGRNKITYFNASVGNNFNQLLLTFFSKRAKLL